MSRIRQKIAQAGHVLPPPLAVPEGVVLPFPWVSIRGDRAYVSGHGPQVGDAMTGPYGQVSAEVGAEVSVADAVVLARLTGLAILGDLERALGDLDRITGWNRVFGMVNSAPGFDRQPEVINGFSALILDIFGPEVGRHARSAVGMAALPFRIAVEIEAEVSIR